jgi:hypothetical protein
MMSIGPVDPPIDRIDSKIVSMLEKTPFESARLIADVQHVDHPIVYGYDTC